MCLGAPDDSFDVKQRELNKALGRVFLHQRALKTPPKVTNGQKVAQFMTDLYDKQVNESESNEGL